MQDEALRPAFDDVTTTADRFPGILFDERHGGDQTEPLRRLEALPDGFIHVTSCSSTSKLSSAMSWVRDMTLFKALLIVYCLNVVAWEGMIFLLLCNAAPAMCQPTCADINSPRWKWIEINSQILNALFCLPAFGLAPRRSRGGWQLVRYTVEGSSEPLRRLAATYRTWFRLPGSQTLPVDVGAAQVESWLSQSSSLKDIVPYPARCVPEAPPSGRRAMLTPLWKLGTVVGLNFMNTLFQAILSGFMWCYNRHTRPPWSVGLFLCLAFASSTAAGVLGFIEVRRVKKVEGNTRWMAVGAEVEEQELRCQNRL